MLGPIRPVTSPSTPPEPPDEGPGPAFPGFKMGIGAPERIEPPPAAENPGVRSPVAGYGWRRLAFWVAVVIAAAVIAWLLLG
jgi:hypothetical protein